MTTKYDYVKKIQELEDKIYIPNIHQATIDMVQEAYIEIDGDGELDLDTKLGSLRYRTVCLIEICDKELIDYKILEELYDILSME